MADESFGTRLGGYLRNAPSLGEIGDAWSEWGEGQKRKFGGYTTLGAGIPYIGQQAVDFLNSQEGAPTGVPDTVAQLRALNLANAERRRQSEGWQEPPPRPGAPARPGAASPRVPGGGGGGSWLTDALSNAGTPTPEPDLSPDRQELARRTIRQIDSDRGPGSELYTNVGDPSVGRVVVGPGVGGGSHGTLSGGEAPGSEAHLRYLRNSGMLGDYVADEERLARLRDLQPAEMDEQGNYVLPPGTVGQARSAWMEQQAERRWEQEVAAWRAADAILAQQQNAPGITPDAAAAIREKRDAAHEQLLLRRNRGTDPGAFLRYGSGNQY